MHKQNESNDIKVNVNNGETKSEINKMRTSNSSQLNIMLNDSEIKCFNLRGKVYERKCVEINLINNSGKKVQVNPNLYHLYIKDLKKEGKKRENFEIDIMKSWSKDNEGYNNQGVYNECAVCSLVNANLSYHLNDKVEKLFSCFCSDSKTHFSCVENEKKKIKLKFCPFTEGNYFCFLLFIVNDKKTNCLMPPCKVNCFFYINNMKEEEVIKMNSKIYRFSYDLQLNPMNKEFLKCIKFILCDLNKMEEKFFYTYLKSYLADIQKGKNNFYVICDKTEKMKIERSSIPCLNFDFDKYVKNIPNSHNLEDIEYLYEIIKKHINCFCTLHIEEQGNGVFEYNCLLLNRMTFPRSITELTYEEIKNSHMKEQGKTHEPFYKMYKIVANVNNEESNNMHTITFNTSAYLMVKKSIPVYNYTNSDLTYRCVYSDILDQNNKKINYNIFSCQENVEIEKDVEFINFEVSCYSIIGITCFCYITLCNVKNEEEQIKIKVQANVMKPYPKDTIHLKLLNRMKETAQIEIYNELDFHCEFKIYSDLFILFGAKKIEMQPKQRKIYTFFVTSAHIGEFMGCIIFKFYKRIHSKCKQGEEEEEELLHHHDQTFPFSNYFFWYKLNITVELNKPLKILFLETNVGDEINKDIVLKNNGSENEEYFLLTYMNEYIERRQVQIPKNDTYVHNIKYIPKIPNYFPDLTRESATTSSGETQLNNAHMPNEQMNCFFPFSPDFVEGETPEKKHENISKELQNFYFPLNEDDDDDNENLHKFNDNFNNQMHRCDCEAEEIEKRDQGRNLNEEGHHKGVLARKYTIEEYEHQSEEVLDQQSVILKQKYKSFIPNEKKIFEEVINYCKKYINVNFNYRNQNIGFFFIYNKNEGINYYILLLLAKLRNELDVREFYASLSKSCIINLHFDFNMQNKRYVRLLCGEKMDHLSGNYHYQIGEGVVGKSKVVHRQGEERQQSTHEDVQAGVDIDVDPNVDADVDPNVDADVDPNVDADVDPNVDAYVDPNVDADVDPNVDADADVDEEGTPLAGNAYGLHKCNYKMEKEKESGKSSKNWNNRICNKSALKMKGKRKTNHELKCIYISNRTNFSILNNDKCENQVVLKYRPTVKTSQECYVIIRSNRYGDFIYRMIGTYRVKKKIKEKLVMYNSCCLYNFSLNMFNPFNCKIAVKCKFIGEESTHMSGSNNNKLRNIPNDEVMRKKAKVRKQRYAYLKKEKRILLNNEKNYFKILNRENFKIQMRKHFTILITYFCKDPYSRRKLLIILKPLCSSATCMEITPIITYEYDFIFNNLMKGNLINGTLRSNNSVHQNSISADECCSSNMSKMEKNKNCVYKSFLNTCKNMIHTHESCICHLGMEKSETGQQMLGNYRTSFSDLNPSEASNTVASYPSTSCFSDDTFSGSERSNFTLNASELSKSDLFYEELKLGDSNENELEKEKHHSVDSNVCDEEVIKNRNVLVREINEGKCQRCVNYSWNDNKEVESYSGKVFIESICKKKTYVKIYIDKTKMKEEGNYANFVHELEKRKKRENNNTLHRNIENGKYNYKIFLLNLKNLNVTTGSENMMMNIKMNNILFQINEEILNDYLYVHIVEDTNSYLVLALELLAFLPFHCSFDVLIRRTQLDVEKLEVKCQVEYQEEYYNEETRIDTNYISVEIFNYMNLSMQHLNIFVDDKLCGETKVNLFYKHTNDSYFDAYIVNYNQLNSSNHFEEEILNYEVRPKSGILKHGTHNKFLIIRNNKNGVTSTNSSFLFLIKTERNIFSYIIFSRYAPSPTGLCVTVGWPTKIGCEIKSDKYLHPSIYYPIIYFTFYTSLHTIHMGGDISILNMFLLNWTWEKIILYPFPSLRRNIAR